MVGSPQTQKDYSFISRRLNEATSGTQRLNFKARLNLETFRVHLSKARRCQCQTTADVGKLEAQEAPTDTTMTAITSFFDKCSANITVGWYHDRASRYTSSDSQEWYGGLAKNVNLGHWPKCCSPWLKRSEATGDKRKKS